jgi:molecular chaperone DnaK (HSP70)
MAQLTGYLCDVCEKFSIDRNGWLKVSSTADKDAKGFDICSNSCLIKLGQRRKTEMGETQNRIRNSKGRTPSHVIDEAVEYSLDHTVQETATKFNVPTSTVHQWRHSRGVTE